jgi:hypothetical protein
LKERLVAGIFFVLSRRMSQPPSIAFPMLLDVPSQVSPGAQPADIITKSASDAK